jgi:gamma-glutamylcyclotransferase (GGCT)/AIG2-like uncharacterized protein YtfP
LRLFVYGTPKRGQRNFGRYCAGALSVQEATVVGRLYETVGGIPFLQIPAAAVLADGTTDPLADLAAQAT